MFEFELHARVPIFFMKSRFVLDGNETDIEKKTQGHKAKLASVVHGIHATIHMKMLLLMCSQSMCNIKKGRFLLQCLKEKGSE